MVTEHSGTSSASTLGVNGDDYWSTHIEDPLVLKTLFTTTIPPPHEITYLITSSGVLWDENVKLLDMRDTDNDRPIDIIDAYEQWRSYNSDGKKADMTIILEWNEASSYGLSHTFHHDRTSRYGLDEFVPLGISIEEGAICYYVAFAPDESERLARLEREDWEYIDSSYTWDAIQNYNEGLG